MLNITDTEDHFQTARSMLRAILMSASTIAADERDSLMLHQLVYAVDGELDAIETALQAAA
ncbi:MULTISPECIES: hypothetical protein [unclassified Mesorhizobium]|uniref:hypothetical protein n=1 Tax=unclassified Mesorhizobium TaxID=325217 RepID=UPI001CCF3C1E|nr:MULTISPECIES: hypothetical protein [unclassified Mesorhizobium]MBZ9741030.1 hypothetical protein [Mesorhizobium sp. CO1-1-4]MBZ9804361.1 hypothetical protein [Mesorhizobium sp. ES1-6]